MDERIAAPPSGATLSPRDSGESVTGYSLALIAAITCQLVLAVVDGKARRLWDEAGVSKISLSKTSYPIDFQIPLAVFF
jgi:hypothetical protein